MSIDFTPLIRHPFLNLARRTDSWKHNSAKIQNEVLATLLRRAAKTEYGSYYAFPFILEGIKDGWLLENFQNILPIVGYEDIREHIMRMVKGEKDVLWPGRCWNFAQSSGTSGGKSKFIPVTSHSLARNHYRGAADTVAHYLRLVPESRLFSGKGFILGGSFANTLAEVPDEVKVGDLSATLIDKINPLANMVRIPDKETALMADWEEKLPALVKAAAGRNVTNISGVPSWFLTVITKIMEAKGADRISDVWPNLEVFFHGGISFEPYRETYTLLTDPAKMHFLETYNASEGFFAVQNDFDDNSMLLIIDRDVFYEFIPVENPGERPLTIAEVEAGKVYELIISSSNGLWRYRLGDTVRVTSINPVKIKIAGRTRSFINAFGEELMEDNAEKAIAAACDKTGAAVLNYTAAPLYASEGKRGRHQWIVEWATPPADNGAFAISLDSELRKLNSDYDAKRAHTIFLDPPEVISAPKGLFDLWLRSEGNHKLGGQRKVPRLSNDRHIADRLLEIINSKK